MELGRIIDKALQPLRRKLRLIATRGVVKLVDPARLLQELQVAAVGEELLDAIEHWEPYGYTSNPQPGAEALLLSLGGDRDHAVAVSVADRRFRLKGLQSGEVALYTDEGDVIHFKRSNKILIDSANEITINAANKLIANTDVAEVTATTSAKVTSPVVDVIASSKVTLNTPQTDLTGVLNVTGLITGQGGLAISGGSGATVQGDMAISGGDVTADGISLKTHVHGGVQAGSDNTGGPQ